MAKCSVVTNVNEGSNKQQAPGFKRVIQKVIIVHFVGLFHSRLPTVELPSVFVHVGR